jgi:MinD superfamily P-loop ATPase
MTVQAAKSKQLIILSGKGGTGKTSLTAALAYLAAHSAHKIQSVLVDADVDAANLGLILDPKIQDKNEFWGGSIAEIDKNDCQACGNCVTVCRYDAIFPGLQQKTAYWIDPIACDGCAACVYACPHDAITMVPQQEGEWYRSETDFGTLYHAELFPGADNSGKLVTLIKQHGRLLAQDQAIPLVMVDGPPGIGCPVISASAGADLGLIVTEPSAAGIADLKRIHETLKHFHIPTVICINKADIYPAGCETIYKYALEEGAAVIGEIPYDPAITNAMVRGMAVNSFAPTSPSALAIEKIWQILYAKLSGNEEA